MNREVISVRPNYVIKGYAETGVYRVIKFKHTEDFAYISRDKEKSQELENDRKLINNISRARSMVLQYALCNQWQWFITTTLDGNKYDRYDLDTFRKDLAQFVRDKRKKYGSDIQYLLIPETHQDGAWHMHGLINGIPDDAISAFIPGVHPQKLINGGFKNWREYEKRFGFVSMGEINDPVATAIYASKYINKDLCSRMSDLGAHLYYASKGLRIADRVMDLYGYFTELEGALTYHGDFCSIGMVYSEDWTFPHRHDLTGIDEMYRSETVPNGKISKLNEKEMKNMHLDPFEYINPEDIITLY